MKIKEQSLLEIQLHRLAKCRSISKIIVATTTEPVDQLVEDEAIRLNVECFKGSEHDVLDRYYHAAKAHRATWVVRVTSDCPLIDPILVDKVVNYVQEQEVDYGSNILIENFPDGQDVEVIKFSALEEAWKKATLKSEREHVTMYLRRNCSFAGKGLFSSANYQCSHDYSGIRMTVDEQNDFEVIKQLIEAIGIDETWEEYTKYMITKELTLINGTIQRNEGLLKSLNND